MRIRSIKAERLRFVMPDEGLVAHAENGAVARLLDELVPARVHDFMPLRVDRAKALVLKPEALVDRGLDFSFAAVCRCWAISLSRSTR